MAIGNRASPRTGASSKAEAGSGSILPPVLSLTRAWAAVSGSRKANSSAYPETAPAEATTPVPSLRSSDTATQYAPGSAADMEPPNVDSPVWANGSTSTSPSGVRTRATTVASSTGWPASKEMPSVPASTVTSGGVSRPDGST